MAFDYLFDRAKELEADYIALRRDIHRHPEFAFEEVQTAALIRRELTSYGYELLPCAIPTAVIALLRGTESGPTIALRSDMDCLAFDEASGLSFSSAVPQRCHACGHDLHAASLLLCARLLSEQREKLHGTVKLIFQPAEEGLKGSRPLIAEHVMDGVDNILGFHVCPDLPSGTIGVRNGAVMASSDRFYITLCASGGHAAHPERTADPILAASLLITQLQTIVSRELSPFASAVVTVGHMIAGTAANIIPSEVRIEGTVRTFDEQTRSHIISSIQRLTDGTALSMNLSAACEYVRGSSPVINDETLLAAILPALQETIGQDHVVELSEPSMEGEDFAFYLDHAPGVFLRIGTANDNEQSRLPLHNPHILFDEQAITCAGSALAASTLKLLQ